MLANKRNFTSKDNKVKVIRECAKKQGLEPPQREKKRKN